MKKVRIEPLHLEICRAELPYGKEFQIIKLSQKQAAQFKSKDVTSFDKLMEQYGENNRLRDGEYYNGYVVVFYYWGKAQLVKMRGMLAENFPEAHHWSCIIPTKESSSTIPGGRVSKDGVFVSIFSFSDCQFLAITDKLKEKGVLLHEIDNVSVHISLKSKLQKAFISEEHLVELNENENYVLREYFGEYYSKFFTEVNY